MMSSSLAPGRIVKVSGYLLGLGAVVVGYGSVIERHAFTIRHITVPVLPRGSSPMKVLHLSDIHMRPGQKKKQQWLSRLIDLEPDLVVNTGDNLAHQRAVPYVIQALGELLAIPGVFVFGSNDYFSPQWTNPTKYLFAPHRRRYGPGLPWQDLRAAFIEHGWHDVTHRVCQINVAGQHLCIGGVDDPHIGRDRYATIAGKMTPTPTLRVGLTHAPEPRVLDCFAQDGYQLVFAGHTHGGQIRCPGYGAIITNSGLDRTRARGLSRWGSQMQLCVSAGLGTSPYAPIRLSCRPEAILLTLIEAPLARADRDQAVSFVHKKMSV